MAVTALLSTAGATNATLYASENMTGMLARVGLFPSFFGPGSRLGAKAGLLITGGVVLVVANFFDLSAIASVGSATALALFLVICAAAYRLRANETRERRLPMIEVLGLSTAGWVAGGVVFLRIWATLAFWPARVARRKGHSFLGYFLLGLLFFPFALLAAHMVHDRTGVAAAA